MQSISVGSLNLLTVGANTGYTVQLPVQGLDAPDYRSNSYAKPGEDGVVLTSLFYGGRTVTLKGVMTATTPAAYEALRSALASAVAVKRDNLGNPIPVTIAFTTLGGSSYFVSAFPQKPLFDYTYATYGDFQLTFLCPDAAVFGSGLISSGLISRPSGGGFILPVILPIVSAGTTGGAGSVTNPGNLAATPILTLDGQLTNPYILNGATGQFIQLNTVIPAGSTVVIDIANKTIMLNGSTPLLSTKTADSSWWTIQPGVNQILLNTNTTSDTGTLLLTFYPGYAGA